MKQYYIVIVQHYNFPECTMGRVEIVDKVFKKWADAEKEREAQFEKYNNECGIRIQPMKMN